MIHLDDHRWMTTAQLEVCTPEGYVGWPTQGPPMPLDSFNLSEIFKRIGQELVHPATLCLIGSSPGIASGQGDRQTPDLDVWYPASDYDTGDLDQACGKVGVLFDPKGDVDPDQIYVQVIRPGIVKLPRNLDLETIARYGNLTVAMPPPSLLAAAKLVRGSEVDVEDVVWWVRHRGMDISDVQSAIDELPDVGDREAASGNIVFVELVVGKEYK